MENIRTIPGAAAVVPTERRWLDGQLKYDALVVLAGGTLAREKGNHVLLAEWIYEVDILEEKQKARKAGLKATREYRDIPISEPQRKADLQKSWDEESRSLTTEIGRLKDEANKLRGEFKFWLGPENKSPVNSTQGRELIERSAKRLSNSNRNGSTTLIQQKLEIGTFSEFLHCLSDEHQKLLGVVNSKFATPDYRVQSPVVSESYDVIRDISVHKDHKFKKPNVSEKGVDQKFYFLDPHSAHNWREVISKGTYDQYKHCLESLELFLGRKERKNQSSEASKIWETFLRSDKFDGAVMLGGGGLEKDENIIESVLRHAPSGNTVKYSIVDVSIYMLMDSVSTLEQEPERLSDPSRVQINPLIWDFTDLRGAKRRLAGEGKNVAWFLPGGTIGNLVETDFLASMRNVASPGDLLVVGMETWGEKA